MANNGGTAMLDRNPARPTRRHGAAEAVDERVLNLTVAGVLDEAAGCALLRAVAEATDTGWDRVQVDLREVSAHTAQGTAAVTKLCRTGSRLPHGIGFSVTDGPSRQALLVSLADA